MLIEEARQLQWITRRLRQDRRWGWLQEFPAEDLSRFLVAPMAVARWLWRERPELLEREHLSLGVAAGELHVFAGGALWPLLSIALGKPVNWARVELVAPPKARVLCAEIGTAFQKQGIVSIVRSEELAYRPAESQQKWDVAFTPTSAPCGLVFALANQKHTLWPVLESGGTLLQGMRYVWETRISDGAAAAGGLSLQVAENPLRGPLILGGDDECAHLVAVSGGERPKDWKRFVEELCMLEEIAECTERFAKQWARSGEVEDFRSWGLKAATKASLDQNDVYAMLPLGFSERVANGKIYQLENDMPVFEMATRIDPATVDPDRVASTTWIGRVWWACQVWSKGLEAEYLNTIGGALESTIGLTARAQRDDLREALAHVGLDAETAKYLTEATAGWEPYSPNRDERVLFEALADGGAEAAINLVRKKPSLANAMDSRRRPLLLAMAELGLKDGMREVVALGGNIHAKDGGHRPIVVQMAQTCETEIVERALDLGANIDEQDPMGWTALQIALMMGKWDMAGMLADRGANTRLGSLLVHSPREMVSGSCTERIAEAMELSRFLAPSVGVDMSEVIKRRGFMNDPSTAPDWLKQKILAEA